MKRYVYTQDAKVVEGYQQFYVDAETRAQADRMVQSAGEIYDQSLDVVSLGEPEFSHETTLDDFGDANPPSSLARISELEAELAALRQAQQEPVAPQCAKSGINFSDPAALANALRCVGGLHEISVELIAEEVFSNAGKPIITDSERQQLRAEGIIFAANRILAAWDAGFLDKPASDTLDVATMILSALEMLPDAPEGDYKRDFADEMLKFLREEAKKEAAPTPPAPAVPDEIVGWVRDETGDARDPLFLCGTVNPVSDRAYNSRYYPVYRAAMLQGTTE